MIRKWEKILFNEMSVLDACILHIKEKHGLAGSYFNRYTMLLSDLKEEYDKALEKARKIAGNPEVIRYLIYSQNSPLMSEIEKNLRECGNIREKESYIFSLLLKFKDLSDVLNKPEDEKSPDYDGRLRIFYLFTKIVNSCSFEQSDEVEDYFTYIADAAKTFVRRLDVLLIKFSYELGVTLDIIKLQEQCGVLLDIERDTDTLAYHFGSREMAVFYLNAFNTESVQLKGNSDGGSSLSDCTQTFHTSGYTKEDLEKIFNALKHEGFIEANTDLGNWLCIFGKNSGKACPEPIIWTGSQISLGALIDELSDSNKTIWKLTKKLFRIRIGTGDIKEPNIRSLAKDKSHIKKKDREYQDWDNLKTILSGALNLRVR